PSRRSLPRGARLEQAVQGRDRHADSESGHVLPGRGLPPGLPRKKPGALPVLQDGVRPRGTAEGAVGDPHEIAARYFFAAPFLSDAFLSVPLSAPLADGFGGTSSCALIFAFCTTVSHWARSFSMWSANSSGVVGVRRAPSPEKRCTISG